MEALLMIDPPPRSIIFGITARQNSTIPFTLTCQERSQFSLRMSRKGPTPIAVPALLKRMSTPPKVAQVLSTQARI